MDPGLRRDDNLTSAGLSAKPSSAVLNIFIARVAEFEEHAAAPNPEPALAGDPILFAQLDQLVKYRSREPRLGMEPGAVAGDPHVETAELDCGATLPSCWRWGRGGWGGIAAVGFLHQCQWQYRA